MEIGFQGRIAGEAVDMQHPACRLITFGYHLQSACRISQPKVSQFGERQ
jgi:hypothetical protein